MKYSRSNDAELTDPQASSVVSYTSEPFPILFHSRLRNLNRFIAQTLTVTKKAVPDASRCTVLSTSLVSMMRYVPPTRS